MYTFLIVILIVNALVLVAAILLQSGKGGGLAASFGGASSAANAFIGGRQAETILTKITWWGAGIFLGLAFILQLMLPHGGGTPKSILENSFPNSPTSQPVQQSTPPAHLPLQPAPGTDKNQPPAKTK